MPGWHAATQDLRARGKFQTLGIIQEQHPERARLFMQWQQMNWPIMVDSFNLLDVAVVPLTLAIDEYGIIRIIRPQAESVAADFLGQTYTSPDNPPTWQTTLPDLAALHAVAEQGSVADWQHYATALAMWGGDGRLDEVIAAGERALEIAPESGHTNFYLGVAYRRRYDSGLRQPDDFRKAIEHWGRALESDPNQYIWRRRIQQYGPRLDKPYPFYDWVPQARESIVARGETPHPLMVEPGGAEFAAPSRDFQSNGATKAEADPDGRIYRDEGEFVEVETVVVPDAVMPGEAARVHLTLRPNLRNKAHWNNEVDDLEIWLSAPDGWLLDNRHLTTPNPGSATSQEMRKLELEIRAPQGEQLEAATLMAYALYYVCEDVDGACLYRRQDIPITIPLKT